VLLIGGTLVTQTRSQLGQGRTISFARPALAGQPDARGDWWMLVHDTRHTGRSAFTGPRTATLKWKFRSTGAGTDFTTAALGTDGTVYVTAGPRIIALQPDGHELWTCDLAGNLSGSIPGADGTLYVMQNQSSLCTLSASGQLQWTYDFPKTVYTKPMLGPDGNVDVGCTDGTLYAINAQGGVAWRFEGGMFYTSGPRLGSDGRLYFLDGHDNLIALDSLGRLQSRTKLQVAGANDLSGDPSSTFAVMAEGKVVALNRDGSRKWQLAHVDPELGRFLRLDVYCELAVRNDGAVFFGDADGEVYALSPQGDELWRHRAKDAVWSKPLLLSDGALAILDGSGLLSVLNLDGGLRWEKNLGACAATHAAAVAGPDGTIYASGGGKFYALHNDGSVAWTYSSLRAYCSPMALNVLPDIAYSVPSLPMDRSAS
jgi:outer membrane protein assembly factor BamB